jgi:uncharacterized protein (DUF2336 family)
MKRSSAIAALDSEEIAGGQAKRVRLAAAPGTSPETLLGLAADPAVLVRAAVAINPSAPPHADRLLAADSDARVRTLLARKLANLLPSLSNAQYEHLQEQVLATLGELVADEVVRVRVAIADVVKGMPDAPHELVMRLAQDGAVAVCDPVIRLSPLLTAEDLLALIAAAPSPYTATAVASRPNLPHAVSDTIAAGDNADAIAALLANGSAAIREATLDALIERAPDHPNWHAPLVRRPRLSGRAAQALSEIVATHLLDELARRADLDPEVAHDLRRRLGERLRAEGMAAAAGVDAAHAMAVANRLADAGALDEDALIDAVHRGEARVATAMLAVAAEVPAAVVDRAARLRSAKGLVSLIWKAGFTMRCAPSVQMLLARLAPANTLRATATGDFPLAVEEMRWHLGFLTQIAR